VIDPGPPRWLPTPALSTALGLMTGLPLLAIAFNRADLVVVATPIGVSTLLALLRRSFRLPRIHVRPAASTLLEDESTDVEWEISAVEPIELVQLRLRVRGWVEAGEGDAHFVTAVQPGSPRRLSTPLRATRWGRGFLDDVVGQAYTAHGLLRADFVRAAGASIRILPLREGFRAVDAVPSAAGVVGLHRSRRPGDGIDLAGVRPFRPGDRLRRINWPVSSRTGLLHVTATYSDRDTEVVLLLDSTVDLGTSAGVAGSASAIDQAVRAAGSIAEHYLRNGDRVGLLDLSHAARPIRSRPGRAQLERLLESLLEVKVHPLGGLAVQRALSRIPANALTIALSPVLSDDVTDALAGLSRAGRSVVVVDTMPARIELVEPSAWTPTAWQLRMLHRDNVLGSLASHGVPVVPWRGSGSLDEVLHGLSRMATAPKALR